jgi:hypothetical protein
MFTRMIIAAALVLTAVSALASDVSSERQQAFHERAQRVERSAPAAATTSAPAKTGPAMVSCACTK